MSSRKPLFFAGGAAAAALIAGCCLCLAVIALFAWQRRLPAAAQIAASSTPTLTPIGLHGLRFTSTPLPSLTPTRRPRAHTPTPDLTQTGILTGTEVFSNTGLLATPTLSPTLALTSSKLISGTYVQIEPSATYAPALDPWCVPLNTVYQNAQVLRVIDGVSIEALLDGRIVTVRYLGIDLPASAPRPDAAALALAHNRELVEGQSVLLARDHSDTDELGHLLRYVLVGGLFVNREMVESGYAVATNKPPDVSCDLVFKQAETLARNAGRGVWGATPTPTRTLVPATPTIAASGAISISLVVADGAGWEDPDEFVEIHNTGAYPVQLQGWTLSDMDGHTFVFPSFVLGAGQYCRVYTNLYSPGSCGFSYFSSAPIWGNVEDCAYLHDSSGRLVDEYCYGW